jgi:hypothetical protein
MSAPENPTPTPQPLPEMLDDANDLRGHHMELLLGQWLTRGLLAGATLLALIGGIVFVGVLVGLIAAVVVAAIGLGIVFAIADSRAADSFFESYARQRNLLLGGKSRLPAATPLLRKGDARYANRTLVGEIAPGVKGTLALYTYEVESTDSKGNQETNYYHYTLGLIEVPECVKHIPELYCQRKFGLRALEKFEDVFRRSKERVKLESEVLDEKYEIFAGSGQDPIFLRRLFAPSFIVWLTDSAPDKFAFELVNGTLCCYVNGHKEDSADLDRIAAAGAAVGARLREEAAESA